MLPLALRDASPYLDREPFERHKANIIKNNTLKDCSDLFKLFLKQLGLCEYCNLYLENLDQCDIHHVKPLSIGGANELSNKSLIHSDCHKIVHNIFGKHNVTVLPYRKDSVLM